MFKKKTLLKLYSKITNLLHSAVLPYQFGFVQCHSYLSDKQLVEIRRMCESKDHAEKQRVLVEYEEMFAKLVGVGSASSFASARMAFYSAMEALGIGEGDEVILTAFTCSVMPNSVMKRGAIPVYADMDRDTFGSNANAIQKVITARTKLIVVQHSFGIPCDIEPIVRLAKEFGIYVLEDCAISLDSSLNGIKVGNWGDAAIFSTDHSKPLNTIIGGILYTRNVKIHEKVSRLSRLAPSLTDMHQRNLYRQIIFERKHYVPSRYPRSIIFNVGQKIWARIWGGKNTVFLEDNYTRPTIDNKNYPYPAAMPAFLGLLGIHELDRWEMQKRRRKLLLLRMIEKFRESSYSVHLSEVYSDPTRDIVPLRFVFSCAGTETSLKRLGQYIDVSWIWFRQPVICAIEGMESLNYVANSCPIAEEICSGIVNFPCNVSDGAELDLLCGVGEIFNCGNE